MASTITAGTLTVTVKESINLNGSEQGGSNTVTFASIAEVVKRILTITTAESTVATFSAAVASADEVAIKLDAGQSFIWNSDNSGGAVDVFNATQDADAASDTALGDLTNIQADANTGSCDLEMFIASI